MRLTTFQRIAGAITVFVIAAGLAGNAQAGVTVIGNGLAKDCYEATERGRPPANRALKTCERALSDESLKAKDRAATYVNRGILLMRSGRYEAALGSYDRSLRLYPELIEAQINRGAALLLLDRPSDALDALNVSINGEADELHAAFYNRALAHEKLGDAVSAYLDLKKALEIKPDFEQAEMQLSRFTVVSAP
ncbi:MAG: tetratricopeptide repeat protein [Pseudomonadota bacterium]